MDTRFRFLVATLGIAAFLAPIAFAEETTGTTTPPSGTETTTTTAPSSCDGFGLERALCEHMRKWSAEHPGQEFPGCTEKKFGLENVICVLRENKDRKKEGGMARQKELENREWRAKDKKKRSEDEKMMRMMKKEMKKDHGMMKEDMMQKETRPARMRHDLMKPAVEGTPTEGTALQAMEYRLHTNPSEEGMGVTRHKAVMLRSSRSRRMDGEKRLMGISKMRGATKMH